MAYIDFSLPNSGYRCREHVLLQSFSPFFPSKAVPFGEYYTVIAGRIESWSVFVRLGSVFSAQLVRQGTPFAIFDTIGSVNSRRDLLR